MLDRNGNPVWQIRDIPAGWQAKTEHGWVRKCWEPTCDVYWTSAECMPQFVREQAEHGGTHPGVKIPGWNVPML